MDLIKLTGFVTELKGMEKYAITAYPVVSMQDINYVANRPDWTRSSLRAVTSEDDEYIYHLPLSSSVTIDENQEVWLIGPKLMTKLHKVAPVLPDLNTTIDFIDSWHSYKKYQISTGTFGELNEFFKPIKQTIVAEIKKQLTNPETVNVEMLRTMVKLADTLPTSKKTLDDYVRYAAFCKYTLDSYEYDFTMNWAILESKLKKEANPEERFSKLVEAYLER